MNQMQTQFLKMVLERENHGKTNQIPNKQTYTHIYTQLSKNQLDKMTVNCDVLWILRILLFIWF